MLHCSLRQASAISFFFVINLINCGYGRDKDNASSNEYSSRCVYEEDNRYDIYDYPDIPWREVAIKSTVALVDKLDLDISDPNDIQPISPTLEEDQELCSDQRFLHQPVAAVCSGTLIDDDKVLTAGHCMLSQWRCDSTRIIFNYAMDSENKASNISSKDMFYCKKILTRKVSRWVDFAIIQLDRPATPRFKPALFKRLAEPMVEKSEVLVIGFPSGLPMKIADNGKVRDARANDLDAFISTTDTFGGNSGSGVYDRRTGELVGILIGGEEDYEYYDEDECYRVLTCKEEQCRGEDSTYLFRALDSLCSTVPDDHLCL